MEDDGWIRVGEVAKGCLGYSINDLLVWHYWAIPHREMEEDGGKTALRGREMGRWVFMCRCNKGSD